MRFEAKQAVLAILIFIIALVIGLCAGYKWGRHNTISCPSGSISYYDKTGKNLLYKDCSY